MADLLIVDDEQSIRQLLSLIFTREGYKVRTADSGRAALQLLRAEPADIIISDVKMPDMNGIELLRNVQEMLTNTAVILMTAHATIDLTREAFKLGAEDFVQKPFEIDELQTIVKRALQRMRLVQENEAFKRAQRDRGSLDRIIGKSSRMQSLYQNIEMVAPLPSTVLITGESGTGKELVARALHNLSPRMDKPFMPVNCGAFTEALLESELFGYVKGAFTGATSNRSGLFEAAAGGTLFLDEIGEMPQPMQVKLLRVLQEKKVRPVGAHKEIETDTRVIAATNRDLPAMVRQGTFREDLHYRISVIPIELPPLRERQEDIPDLVSHFLQKYCRQNNRNVGISPTAMQLLENYTWPGNVRQLEHIIERAVALERTDQIQPERLPDAITEYNPTRIAAQFSLPEEGINLVAHMDQLERTYLLESLQRTGGNQTKASELLHLSVRSLRHLLDKHQVRGLTAQMRVGRLGEA